MCHTLTLLLHDQEADARAAVVREDSGGSCGVVVPEALTRWLAYGFSCRLKNRMQLAF